MNSLSFSSSLLLLLLLSFLLAVPSATAWTTSRLQSCSNKKSLSGIRSKHLLLKAATATELLPSSPEKTYHEQREKLKKSLPPTALPRALNLLDIVFNDIISWDDRVNLIREMNQ